MLAVAVLGQIRLTFEQPCSATEPFVKWEVFERLQRVEEDKGRDGPLSGQQIRGSAKDLADPHASLAGVSRSSRELLASDVMLATANVSFQE